MSISRFNVLASLFALIAIVVGCDLPNRPPLSPAQPGGATDDSQTLPRALAPAVESVGELPAYRFGGDWESWDAYYIRNQPVGFIHITAEAQPGTDRVQYTVDHRLLFRRHDSTLLQRFTHHSGETVDGKLIGFDCDLHIGPAVTRLVGTVDEATLKIESVRGSEQESYDLDWTAACRGLVAVEQSLRGQPMQAGQQRTLQMPIMSRARFVMATVRLQATGMASVPLLGGGQRSLLEINTEASVNGGQLIKSVLWADPETGIVLRSYSPATHLLAYRTDRETAIGGLGGPGVVVPLISFATQGQLSQPAQRTRVAFRISPRDSGDESTGPCRIDPAPDQYVRALDDGRCDVLVSRRQESVSEEFVTSSLQPGQGDRQASSIVDSNHPLIGRYVELSLTESSPDDHRQAALLLTETVQRMAKNHAFQSTGIVPASQVGQQDASDSTQRAILLIAMLRAHGIPSRLASGLVYVPTEPPQMEYQSWALAYLDQQWVSLDPIRGAVAAPDRITFATTDLSDGSGYASIDPIIAAVGQIEIEVVGAQ